MGFFKTSRGHSTTRRRHRKLRKQVRETITIALIGMVGAVLMVSMWIGSVIQTSERLSEMSVEVME